VANPTSSPDVKISLGSMAVDDTDFLSYVAERDMFQADMAQIVVSNQGSKYSKAKIGDPVEIKVGDQQTSVYKGEIVNVEPTFKGGEKTRVVIRAMNKLHRLLRIRKSVTFTDKTDQQILNQVVSDAGLSLEWKHEKSITYKHVYQHNQSAMEFLRMRAGRMGCHVWCVGTTVYCKQPELQAGPIAEFKLSESSTSGTLRSFTPRMSGAAIVKKMTVKGWNPETKELITGEANAEQSKLGGSNAQTGAGDLGDQESYSVDTPVWSKEEADAIAKAKLQDISLGFMTGEAEITGDPDMDLGKIVNIMANSDPNASPDDDPFNGKYYIMGLTHRHSQSKSTDGGFITILRLARDAQKKGG
jgi:hypothetical protein